ncbi:MAG: cation diffusion facilitator family transporter [Desulfosarcinaceae bacterium]|nr:cation diffusion facilitator family transporter [Desulfosarcinaceae bacterium]
MAPPLPRPDTYWTPALKKRVVAVTVSLVVGTALMGLKFYIYRLTHSSAVLSDALESIINVVASGFAMGSILFAALPPDEDHPYGHGKIEFFSAGFEGALIFVAALGIFYTGIRHLISPHPLPHLESGLLLLLATSVINLALGIFLIRVGRHTASLALEADGRHILTDVYTSAGVVLGLLLVYLTGWLWLDGLIACLVGGHILFAGGGLLRQAFAGLMDRSDPNLLDDLVAFLNANRRPRWLDIHRLRAFRSGARVNVDFHLVLPRDLSLAEAHTEVKALEHLIEAHFDDQAIVLIHMDPCHPGKCPRCQWRSKRICNHPKETHASWTRTHLTRVGGQSAV